MYCGSTLHKFGGAPAPWLHRECPPAWFHDMNWTNWRHRWYFKIHSVSQSHSSLQCSWWSADDHLNRSFCRRFREAEREQRGPDSRGTICCPQNKLTLESPPHSLPATHFQRSSAPRVPSRRDSLLKRHSELFYQWIQFDCNKKELCCLNKWKYIYQKVGTSPFSLYCYRIQFWIRSQHENLSFQTLLKRFFAVYQTPI